MLAKVVLPVPGGPQKIMDGSIPVFNCAVNEPFGPTKCCWLKYSSRVLGLILSARGVFIRPKLRFYICLLNLTNDNNFLVIFRNKSVLPIYHTFGFRIVICYLLFMTGKQHLDFDRGVIGFPILFVMLMWIVFWVESRFGVNFNRYGIYPRTPEGLIGIFTGPFIHGSLKHLFNNSVPLLVLCTALFYFYRNIRWKVILFGLILTGLATWVIGRPSLHIGASGVVYMLVAFLFFKGVFSRQFQLTALALVVVFLYGGLLWFVFPMDPKISWEGHLSGFMVGFLFSFLFRGVPLENKKYEWEKEDFNEDNDPFIQQFDEDGNFIGTPKPEDIHEVEQKEVKQPIRIVYTVTKKDEDAG